MSEPINQQAIETARAGFARHSFSWLDLLPFIFAALVYFFLGRYLALGITVSVVLQAIFNISVVLDMGPSKGIPLPMISYGGSSILSTLTSLGLLLSVSERAG